MAALTSSWCSAIRNNQLCLLLSVVSSAISLSGQAKWSLRLRGRWPPGFMFQAAFRLQLSYCVLGFLDSTGPSSGLWLLHRTFRVTFIFSQLTSCTLSLNKLFPFFYFKCCHFRELLIEFNKSIIFIIIRQNFFINN